MVLASAGLLGNRIYSLAESERAYVYLTYPYALLQESKGQSAHGGASPQAAQDTAARRDIGPKMITLSQTISDPLSKMRSFVTRDYFLELIESSPDLTNVPVIYPRMSFGTGQRYASKGCYIVQLSDGHDPKLLRKSDWVIH